MTILDALKDLYVALGGEGSEELSTIAEAVSAIATVVPSDGGVK